jgi:GT2 family glycosyltransferase
MNLEQALRRSLFVILAINGGARLARMLSTLNIPTELIVVLDRKSTDDTAEVCRAAGVQYLQLGHPHFYTKACNVASRIAKERSACP